MPNFFTPSPGIGGGSALSLGGVGDAIGDWATKTAIGIGSAGVDALVAKIAGGADQGGGANTLGVRPDRVQGLGALLQFGQGAPPPTNNAGQDKRGNWVRDAASAVLGLPREAVWLNNQTKTDAYLLMRSYLQAFDGLTGGKYNLAATIPAPSGQCGSTPCSDSPNTYPYDLIRKLQAIGATGLKAIDATWNGQGLDDHTVQYLTDEVTTDADPSAWQQLLDALKAAGSNVVDTATTVVSNTARGAATGAVASSEGASRGATAGGQAVFGLPTGLLVLGVGGLALFFLVKR